MGELFNAANRTELRRRLRRDRSEVERLLWRRLSNRQVRGVKFRRQHGIGPFVVDFYCVEHRLAIEIDGRSHDGDDAVRHDAARQRYLEGVGITVLRYTNDEVLEQTDAVVEAICIEMVRRGGIQTTPSPSMEGRGIQRFVL